MAKIHKQYFSVPNLQKRGWIKPQINSLMSEPDKYDSKTKEPLYKRIRVERIEKKENIG